MILWGILWVLLGLIALVVFVVLLIIILLAIPIRYEVRATTGEDNGNVVFVRISYLLRLVRMVYEYQDGAGQRKVKILWFTLGKKKADLKPRKDKPDSNDKHETKTRIPFLHTNKTTKSVEPEEETPPVKWHQSLKNKYINIKNSINDVLTYPNRKIIIDLALSATKKLFKILRPKRFRVTGTVGFADPSTTGIFVGVCEMVVMHFDIGKYVRLGGDFDSSKTEAHLKINAKGSISLGRIVLLSIGLLLKKPVRTLIKDLR